MSKLCVLVFFMFGILALSAQSGKGGWRKYPDDWHLRSYEKDTMYGAAVYEAYEYLKGRQPKQRVVVAVIDGGLDTSHEDLRGCLWTNEDEIPGNGIDDDRNGYADDVHGWNFLGKADGSTVANISTEADRCFVSLRGRFEGADTSRMSAEELRLYHYYRRELPRFSNYASEYWVYAGMKSHAECAEAFDRRLKEKFPGVELTQEHFLTLREEYASESAEGKAFAFFADRWKYSKGFTWAQMFNLRNTLLKTYERRYLEAKRSFESDGRDSLGDDLNDVTDRRYGNGVMRPHEHGSHVAGIIGADRHNGAGIQGVADVRLMNLIVCTGTGDEYDKDLANAIRYAVENGAQIINISLGRPVSTHREWVEEALLLAQEKGVLVVHAAGNEGRWTDGAYNYPTRHLSSGGELSNFINVGNSFADGLPVNSSNFGKDEVDLFAPGGVMYSTVTDNQYKAFSGTSMAAPVVAGVAALIWNYFPDLSAEEVKEVILEGVTSRKGVAVVRPRGIDALGKETVRFEDLCATGGILNALESVKLAEKK